MNVYEPYTLFDILLYIPLAVVAYYCIAECIYWSGWLLVRVSSAKWFEEPPLTEDEIEWIRRHEC